MGRWIFKDDNRFCKVLEGKYIDEGGANCGKSRSGRDGEFGQELTNSSEQNDWSHIGFKGSEDTDGDDLI